jgi:uncharacterized protein (TIGR02246 family)
VELPRVLTDYFAAANAKDADRIAACFTDDAVVRDERRDWSGRDAIRAWAEETQRKYRYRAEVVKTEVVADRTVVTALLTGDFPGSPIHLRYRFKLAGSQIGALEIGP